MAVLPDLTRWYKIISKTNENASIKIKYHEE